MLLLCCTAATAARDSYRPNVGDIDAIPLHVLPKPADAGTVNGSNKSGQPYTFAKIVSYSLGLDDGEWTTDGDDAIWRVHIESIGATALILKLHAESWSSDARLYWYNDSGSLVQGPLGERQLPSGNEVWTPMLMGESGILEIRVPESEKSDVDLSVDSVATGFSDPLVATKSGSCNIDVACSEADDWSDQVRATVKIQVPLDSNYVAWCTGSLVNAATQDRKPRILTATHCEIDSDNVSGVIAYFNYQHASCGGTDEGSLSENLTGAELLFQDTPSDTTLIEMEDSPPAAYDAYLDGWYVGSSAATSGAAVHHPSGDEKSISLFDTTLTRQTISLEGVTEKVSTWAVTWSEGTTEEGSSGAGLLNQDHRIVGVLSGGGASCSATSEADYFGRLETAWSNGLDAYLDPDSSGVTSLDGIEATAEVSATDDTVSVTTGSTGNIIDVLDNDTGSDLSITAVSAPSGGGSVTIDGDALSYDAPSSAGTDTFTYTVEDGDGNTDTATVTVTITEGDSTDGTGVTTGDSDDSSDASSGGGALGVGTLGLLSLLLWRRRRI